MRNPNRLYEFYKQLQEIHITFFPDWCFSQLISNFQVWIANEKEITDIYFIEEAHMLKHIREFAEKYGNK